jgi:4-amino-4-deoxy-L-arabinose transferase-like glycosyltransferase
MQTLPLLPEADEGTWIGAAFQIAATGNLDPGFYGHPGATTLLPLAAVWRLWLSLFSAQEWATTLWQMHFAGRLLSVAYYVLAVLTTAKLGIRVWNPRVGVAAGWILAVSPLVVFYAKLLRTDTAATFWGALALLLSLRLLDSSSLRRQFAAGAAIGLSIASRYFLAATGLVLVLGRMWFCCRAQAAQDAPPRLWWSICAGLLAVPLVFLLVNPAMPFHWQQVLHDLTAEARVEHLGADGLGLLGNLSYYFAVALPAAFKWPLTLLTWAGALLALWRGNLQARFLLAWAAAFLLLISVPSLHWDRWLIPALPVLALFAAAALDWVAGQIAARWFNTPAGKRRTNAIFALVAFLLLCAPLAQSLRYDISLMGMNTRLQARAWLEENAAPESLVLQETYGAPLEGVALESQEIGDFFRFAGLAESDPGVQITMDEAGYLVASSYIYDRYYAEPQRYPDAIAFYDRLFAEGNLLAEFAPNWRQNGPVVRIYRGNLQPE